MYGDTKASQKIVLLRLPHFSKSMTTLKKVYGCSITYLTQNFIIHYLLFFLLSISRHGDGTKGQSVGSISSSSKKSNSTGDLSEQVLFLCFSPIMGKNWINIIITYLHITQSFGSSPSLKRMSMASSLNRSRGQSIPSRRTLKNSQTIIDRFRKSFFVA